MQNSLLKYLRIMSRAATSTCCKISRQMDVADVDRISRKCIPTMMSPDCRDEAMSFVVGACAGTYGITHSLFSTGGTTLSTSTFRSEKHTNFNMYYLQWMITNKRFHCTIIQIVLRNVYVFTVVCIDSRCTLGRYVLTDTQLSSLVFISDYILGAYSFCLCVA